jgi:hypothetical protein
METPAGREREHLFTLLLPREDLRDNVILIIGTRRFRALTHEMNSNGATVTYQDLLRELSNSQLQRLCKRNKIS